MKSSAPLLSFAVSPHENRVSSVLRTLIAVGGTVSGIIWSIVLASPMPLFAFVTLILFSARLTTALGTPALALPGPFRIRERRHPHMRVLKQTRAPRIGFYYPAGEARGLPFREV